MSNYNFGDMVEMDIPEVCSDNYIKITTSFGESFLEYDSQDDMHSAYDKITSSVSSEVNISDKYGEYIFDPATIITVEKINCG